MRAIAMLWIACCTCAFIAHAAVAAAAPCVAGAKWTEPAPPLKIHGNTWFVGTCGLSSILITSPQGHVLIDGAVEEAAPLIEANIRALGLRVSDVRFIVSSHEHYDHVGGVAQLQRDSGAIVLAREPAAAVLERGQGDRGDPQLLILKRFPPVSAVRRIADDEVVRLGPIALTPHATPGHTRGSTTWTWPSCKAGRCLQIVYADSLSAVADDVYRYSADGALGAAFRGSIVAVGALPCDILLTPHPDASAMWTRLGSNAASALIDSDACRRYADDAQKGLEARLAKERADAR